MNDSPLECEERLRIGLGDLSSPEFQAWCDFGSDAVAALQRVAEPVPLSSSQAPVGRACLMTSRKRVVAFVVILGLAWMGAGAGGLSSNAFADVIPSIDGVQATTWTDTYCRRLISEDGKRTRIQKNFNCTPIAIQASIGKQCRTKTAR